MLRSVVVLLEKFQILGKIFQVWFWFSIISSKENWLTKSQCENIFKENIKWLTWDLKWRSLKSFSTGIMSNGVFIRESRQMKSKFFPNGVSLTRKSSPWGNFSDGGLNQSINQSIKNDNKWWKHFVVGPFGWLIDLLTISYLWLDWFIGCVPHDLFLRGRG